MGFGGNPDFLKSIEIMSPEVKNAHYGRLALVSYDLTPVS